MQTDAEQYLPIYQTLCDSLHQYRLAIEICQYYLGEHKLDSVPYYLSLAEQDTANSVWSKEHYLFNKAWYKYEIGQKDSAYFILRDLHLWQTEEIDMLYILLILLGCSNNEISELVNVSAQSVRNRKMLIKEHVGCSTNIEEWLRKEAENRN